MDFKPGRWITPASEQIRNDQLQEFCFLRKRAESFLFSIGRGRCSLWRELNKIINNEYE